MHQLIGTSRMEKMAPCEVEGYWYNISSNMDSDSSPGFIMRKKLFLDKNNKFTGKARVCGFLYHDLIDNQAGNYATKLRKQ